jgi:hypothetical protein
MNVLSPPSLAGTYTQLTVGAFTPLPYSTFGGTVSVASPLLGCDPLTTQHNGTICLMQQGNE